MFEPRIETITKVIWDGEDEVEIKSGGGTWCGAKRKDFWNPEHDWESEIKEGTKIKLWTIQWSRIIGFQIERDGLWVDVWCKGNNFQTKVEREKSSEAYANFAMNEGKKIAEAIDGDKTLEQIDDLISDDHTGNTYGWALNYGISNAKNRKNADKIRLQHNKKYGVTDSDGVVNPAVLTLGT